MHAVNRSLLMSAVFAIALVTVVIVAERVGASGDASSRLASAPFSKVSELPTVSSPPGDLGRVVAAAARGARGDESVARSTLRLVRDRLGVGHERLYAFEIGVDRRCVVLWRRGVACEPPDAVGLTPGLVLDFSPGGPGYVGQSDDLPAAIAGIVTENVARVEAVLNGQSQAATIFNGGFFLSLGGIPRTGPWSLQVLVTYDDGSQRSVTFPDPRP